MTWFVVMGVSGCGKSTVGKALAECLGWQFVEGDDFHPQHNIDKMAAGSPLDDDDRAPWLARLNELIREEQRAGRHGVLSCSALKAAYRAVLRAGAGDLRFVYLRADEDELKARLSSRHGHFMGPEMLASQLADLEEPAEDEALTIESTLPPKEITDLIVQRSRLSRSSS